MEVSCQFGMRRAPPLLHAVACDVVKDKSSQSHILTSTSFRWLDNYGSQGWKRTFVCNCTYNTVCHILLIV